MNRQEIIEILACMPRGRTPFYYFKDRYALMLMGLAFDKPVSKAQVREAGYGRLLDKQIVKEAIGKYGKGKVSAEICDAHWPLDPQCYMLKLGAWGMCHRWSAQTSRRGYNIVLQLNFTMQHTKQYHDVLDPDEDYYFECYGHPVTKDKRRTLAWSRIDVDLDSDEALIEEIQNDWLRIAMRARKRAERFSNSILLRGKRVSSAKVIEYVDEVLAPHFKIWDEAMLAATIWFLREEIGISRIFYHTHEYGSKLKRIDWSQPPRSLYTALPRRFCFEQTDECPELLMKGVKTGKNKRLLKEAQFQKLQWE